MVFVGLFLFFFLGLYQCVGCGMRDEYSLWVVIAAASAYFLVYRVSLCLYHTI